MRKQWFAKPWWVAAMNNRTGNPFSGLLARRSLADGHPTEVERIIDTLQANWLETYGGRLKNKQLGHIKAKDEV